MGNDKQKNKKAVDAIPAHADEAESVDVGAFIQSLPEDKRDLATRMYIGVAESKVYQGPLPAPEDLTAYEDILPGAAREIIDMAKTQQEHRIDCERKIIEYDIRTGNRGQWMGFVLGILCIAGSLFAAYIGYAKLSYLLAAPALLGVIGVFVLKQFPDLFKKKEDSSKDYK